MVSSRRTVPQNSLKKLIFAKCVQNHKFPAISLCKMPNKGSLQIRRWPAAALDSAAMHYLSGREASPMVNWSQFTIHKVQSSAVLPCFYCRGK